MGTICYLISHVGIRTGRLKVKVELVVMRMISEGLPLLFVIWFYLVYNVGY